MILLKNSTRSCKDNKLPNYPGYSMVMTIIPQELSERVNVR